MSILKTKILLISQLAVLLTLTFSCKDEQQQVVPNVYVNFSVNLELPQFIKLNSITNAVIYPNAGYDHNGVVIYRNSIDEFYAFDATCPQHIDVSTAIKLDDNGSGGQATCPHCKTVYYFYEYGAASKGYPLKRYSVIKSGNTLFISN